MIRWYREETGLAAVEMREVVKWAVLRGWQLPRPIDPLDRETAEFAQAAREEYRPDPKTGRPYRVNHAVPVGRDGQWSYLWFDIDNAPRPPMLKALVARREQIVSDVLHLTDDADHWNSINPDEEPILIQTDF